MSEELKAEVIIGDDAEAFVDSELGRTVLGMAEQDAKAAMLEFADCDVTDLKAVMKIQQDVRVAVRFRSYLGELMTKGREALQAWKAQQNES